ncbi:MAG TPA: C40 family peptidase, partial [Acidimicrobiales bacterium]|nr:C40 family peptidase [Acidimicrobiales bacterium]
AKESAEATVADQESLLNSLTGRIATLVAQRQAAEAAAAHAAFEARLSASSSSAGSSAGGGGPGRVLPALPPAGGAAAAVAAAESQIGVPYVWGGESPGHGFDCSGLVQWAWRQAGVDLPRTAAAQYDAIPHIPLSDLQPGDLVFWAYGGGVSHVGMYVGGGSVVDAPQTGQDVQLQPIWNGGLVGAGRP